MKELNCKIKISPSVLASDFSKLGEEVHSIGEAGAEWVHLDIMDGVFVPNISFGAPIVKAVRNFSDRVFDVHLMIIRPQNYVEDFVKAGADLITFHLESECNALEVIEQIHAHGVRAGVAIKPGTPAEAVEHLIGIADMILVMTVEPGFGGQKFMRDMMPKVQYLRRKANEKGIALDIQVDGGIDGNTAAEVLEAGANVLVAGTYFFRASDRAQAVELLRISEK